MAPRAGGAPGKRERTPRREAQQAIVAALEHGSHTVGELLVVTAMSGASVRENLRRLLAAGTITRATREGKAAYALAHPAER
jgi:DNA-binding MarR family transcriptional regulator